MAKKKPSSHSAFGRLGGQKKRGKPLSLIVKIKLCDKKKLKALLSRGRESARVFKRARILQILGTGKSSEKAAESVGVSVNMARRVAHNYREKGLERALREAPRPGQKPLIRPREEAQLIAMVCGPSPQGRARWTVSLVAEEANRRGITKAKKETIRLLMKRNALKPWREKNVVRPRVDE